MVGVLQGVSIGTQEARGEVSWSVGTKWNHKVPHQHPNVKLMATVTGKVSLSASGRAEQKQRQFPNKSSVQEIHDVVSWLSEPGDPAGGRSDS